jgi:hypothetical protein
MATVLSQSFSAISQATSYVHALEQLLQIVCSQTQWVMGEAWLPCDDKSLRHSGIWYTTQEDLQNFATVSTQYLFDEGEGLLGRVWQQGQTEWLMDVSHCTI